MTTAPDIACPHCEGSGGGPGYRFNPMGACGYCEGSGVIPADQEVCVRSTMEWIAEVREAYS